MTVRPLHDRVLIKRIEEQETVKGGIIIPDTAKEKSQEGEVIAVGAGKMLENGSVAALEVKEGDRILFGKYSGTEIKMLTKIMMWVSVAVVLLALLELPVTSEPVLVEIVVCASGVLVLCQAVRAGQYLLATGFLPIVVAFSPISPIAISGRAFLWLNWIGLAAFLVAVIALKTERTLSMPSITNRTPRRESL